MEQLIKKWFKEFCKETKRSGGVLVHASITEWHKWLGQKLDEHLNKSDDSEELLYKCIVVEKSIKENYFTEEEALKNYKVSKEDYKQYLSEHKYMSPYEKMIIRLDKEGRIKEIGPIFFEGSKNELPSGGIVFDKSEIFPDEDDFIIK